MKTMKSKMLLIVLVLLINTLSAATLEVFSADDTITLTEWNYREVATRNWFGCWQYDFLQGSGWFRATWHNDFTPVEEDGAYIFQTEHSLMAKFCNAQMDQYNLVQIEKTDTDGTVLKGRFSLIPGGEFTDTTVICTKAENGNQYNSISCEDAYVDWSRRSYITVEIIWE